MARMSYSDLTEGRIFDLGSVRIEKDDMLDFNARFDPQPFHLDEEAGRASILGGLCASGWYTVALWMRAYVDTVLAGSTSLGSPGGRDIRWPRAVYPGDTLDMRLEIVSARVSRSKPDMGLVDLTGTSWRGEELVLSLTFTGFFGVLGGAGAAG
ncbi:MAG: MaoC family dehydratase [Sciscionella sp.]